MGSGLWARPQSERSIERNPSPRILPHCSEYLGHSLPLDTVLGFLLDQPNALQNICDVVDSPFLPHCQGIRCLGIRDGQLTPEIPNSALPPRGHRHHITPITDQTPLLPTASPLCPPTSQITDQTLFPGPLKLSAPQSNCSSN